MKLQELRELAWGKISLEECSSEVAVATKGLPGDWIISFLHKKDHESSAIGFFTKSFHIPSEEFGTAFKLRIKQIENLLNCRCHEIKPVPGSALQITLAMHGPERFTIKDAKMAEMINRAYGPNGTNRVQDFSGQELSAQAPCVAGC